MQRLQEFMLSQHYTYQSNAEPFSRVTSDIETYAFSVRNSVPALANRALHQLDVNLRQHWHEVGTAAVSLVYDPNLRLLGSLQQVLVKVAYELGADPEAHVGGGRYGSAYFLEDLQEERAYQNMLSATARGPRHSPPAVWYHDELSRRMAADGPSHALWGFLSAARHLLRTSPDDGRACIAAIWRIARLWESQQEAEGIRYATLSLLAPMDSDSNWRRHIRQLVLLHSQLTST
ncbi:hypothetical protein BDV29DRAFT_163018 [Aspergillus leporis]|uniref:Uncharacterized protein n=1 Tax=Aspergillus leporis TaxID=41062 RepID=A0A5N5WH96_9EURO|nr:hypothetical protein BDV29DRAFT_163018 [Aspergillus leporis]